MKTYVTMFGKLGSNTVACYDDMATEARQDSMQRAIDDGSVYMPGTYVVAVPEERYLCAQLFHIDEVSTPRFVIR